MKPRRLVAALLGTLLLFQCLPLTIPSPADCPGGAGLAAKCFFETLQVCDHGESTAYLANHPWIPGTGFRLSTPVNEESLPDIVKIDLSEGFPRAVYKPPRTGSS